jgi:hypothetical protein
MANRGLNEATQVIMHSAYGTMEQMREAFKDYDVADFVTKSNPEVFLKSIQYVFEKKVKVNLDLKITWLREGKPEQAITDLRINGRRVGRSSSLRKQLVEELDDLFCRLFYEAEMILVRPLKPGWSGTSVVLVQPFFAGRGRGEDVIVKFGDITKIKKEYNNFQDFVEKFLRGGRRTTIKGLRYTPHLGGIVYSLLGANNDQLIDFAEFYHSKDDVFEIVTTLDRLFQMTCGNWYVNRSNIMPLDLAEDYQKLYKHGPRKLEQIIANYLSSVQAKEKLIFNSLDGNRQFTNPLAVTIGLSFTCYTFTCITHGDFNPYNLFVDQEGFSWLIDFQSTGPGHILRDFAMLDSIIRFLLLTELEATLEERLQMEEALCKPERFSQLTQLANEFTTENRALAKAFAAVVHVRTLAGKQIGQNARDDMGEYYVALYYNALTTLRYTNRTMVQLEHALLSASLLADKLGLRS